MERLVYIIHEWGTAVKYTLFHTRMLHCLRPRTHKVRTIARESVALKSRRVWVQPRDRIGFRTLFLFVFCCPQTIFHTTLRGGWRLGSKPLDLITFAFRDPSGCEKAMLAPDHYNSVKPKKEPGVTLHGHPSTSVRLLRGIVMAVIRLP